MYSQWINGRLIIVIAVDTDKLLSWVTTVWQLWENLVDQYPLLFIQIALIGCLYLVLIRIWRKRNVYLLAGRKEESGETES